jgi:hypothetical protein
MRIKGDDVFNRKEMFPEPRHESLALSKQATMCYVLLFFTPDVLTNKDTMMREIVDKHFSDNWVLPYHLGELVDLTVEWQRYPAAKKALGYTMQVDNVKQSFNSRASRVRNLGDTLRQCVSLMTFVFIWLYISLIYYCRTRPAALRFSATSHRARFRWLPTPPFSRSKQIPHGRRAD